ncbi:hypothetical protein [Moorena sp. SIO3E8]|nr:hypothetical protein [Moorena sp. SIO3E8]NEO17692.1 hypothetical protein [Moorena sp. SIO3E8]NEQ03805.1 hypothetical protein [Moorena sp. SIO3F7]
MGVWKGEEMGLTLAKRPRGARLVTLEAEGHATRTRTLYQTCLKSDG